MGRGRRRKRVRAEVELLEAPAAGDEDRDERGDEEEKHSAADHEPSCLVARAAVAESLEGEERAAGSG